MTLYVICGPPAAGKSSWVTDHAKHGDIIIDYDRIATAFTAEKSDTHHHPPAVKSVAHAARKAAVAAALRHTRDTDCFIIHSLPTRQALAMYAEHDAHIVTVDPGQDVVMDRCQRMRSSQAVAAACRWYANHAAVTTATQSSRVW